MPAPPSPSLPSARKHRLAKSPHKHSQDSPLLLPLPMHHQLLQAMPPTVSLRTSAEAFSLVSLVFFPASHLRLSFSLRCESFRAGCVFLLASYPAVLPQTWAPTIWSGHLSSLLPRSSFFWLGPRLSHSSVRTPTAHKSVPGTSWTNLLSPVSRTLCPSV